MDHDKNLEFAAKAFDRILGFFPRVDGRAQVLMGIDLAMLYLLAVNVPNHRSPWWAILAFASATVLLCASLVKIYRVFFPQLRGPELSLIYFQEIVKLRQGEFVDRFTVQSAEGHTKDVLAQMWRNSEILNCKFQDLRDGMIAAGIAMPFWAFGLVYSAVTKGPLVLR